MQSCIYARAIEIWWYPEYPSKLFFASYHAIVLRTSSIKGNGYGSFFVTAFSFLKVYTKFQFAILLGYYYFGWQTM